MIEINMPDKYTISYSLFEFKSNSEEVVYIVKSFFPFWKFLSKFFVLSGLCIWLHQNIMNSEHIKNQEQDQLYNFDETNQSQFYCQNQSEQTVSNVNPNNLASTSPITSQYQTIRVQIPYNGDGSAQNSKEGFQVHNPHQQGYEQKDYLSIENLDKKRTLPMKYHIHTNNGLTITNLTNSSNFNSDYRPPWNSSAQIYEPRTLKYQIYNEKDCISEDSVSVTPNHPKLVRNLGTVAKFSNTNTEHKERDKSQNNPRPYWKYAYKKDANPKVPTEMSKRFSNSQLKVSTHKFGINYKVSSISRIPSQMADCFEDKSISTELTELKSANSKLTDESNELRWKFFEANNDNRTIKAKCEKLSIKSEELASENKLLKDEIFQVNHKANKALKCEQILKAKILELEKLQKANLDEVNFKENELVHLRMENNSLRKLNDRLRQDILLNSQMDEFNELESMFKNVMKRRGGAETPENFNSAIETESQSDVQEQNLETESSSDLPDKNPETAPLSGNGKSPESETIQDKDDCGNSANDSEEEKETPILIASLPNISTCSTLSVSPCPSVLDGNQENGHDSSSSPFGDNKNIKNRLLERLFKRQKPLFIIGFGDTLEE